MWLSRSLCAGLILLGAATAAAGQQTRRFSYPEHGFSIALPAEWQAIAPGAVQQYDSATPPPPGVRDLAGFRPLPSSSPFAPPFLLVRRQSASGFDKAGLQRMALDPVRRIGVAQWLDELKDSYGAVYDPALFGWDPRDAILWMVGSGPVAPYPDVIILTGAVAFHDDVLLVVYQVFPSMDLAEARNTVRSALRSLRAES